MSWQSAEEPETKMPSGCKALDRVIVPRPRDLGGFEVRRVLPALERRSVGPLLSRSHGTPDLEAGGASTCGRIRTSASPPSRTYSTATIIHRDSLGYDAGHRARRSELDDRGARHRPLGALGRQLRKQRHKLYGIQIWVALPQATRGDSP